MNEILLAFSASVGALQAFEGLKALTSSNGKNIIDWAASTVEFLWMFVSCYAIALGDLGTNEKILYSSFVAYTSFGWVYGAYSTFVQGSEGKEVLVISKLVYVVSVIFGFYFSSYSIFILSGNGVQ